MNTNDSLCILQLRKHFIFQLLNVHSQFTFDTFSENVDASKVAVFLVNLIGTYEWSG